jgi:hypothetical protein
MIDNPQQLGIYKILTKPSGLDFKAWNFTKLQLLNQRITMKSKSFILLVVILSFSICQIYGQLLKDTVVVDYKSVDRVINEKIEEYGANNVLVVMDIDNTILTGDSDLGSDLWYQWQRGELDVKPTPEQKLPDACLFNEAIGLLYELGTMTLTDSLLPGYIHEWQSDGVTLFALTSRSPNYRAATERELRKNNVDLTVSELNTADGSKLFFNFTLNRSLSYYNGIFMTSGMNKGEMLTYILGLSGRQFKAIIFIDDSPKNIDAVKSRYFSCNTYDIVLFQYNKIISERLRRNNNVILTKAQADQMANDWGILVNTLNMIFPDRANKSECIK